MMFYDKLMKIKDRSKCFDIFWLIKVGDTRMYREKPIEKHVQFRVQKAKLYDQFTKMQLMKCLKAFVGYGKTTYLEIVLKEIQVAKELFIQQLC